jgi:transcriptional regulator with XRE-family HTH domain
MRAACAEPIGYTASFGVGTLVRVDSLIERVQELMELRGWTAHELAHKAGLSDSLISNWIRRGVKRPDPEAVRKLAAAAGVPYWSAWARLKMPSVVAMLRAA